jgi:hypothetical protein
VDQTPAPQDGHTPAARIARWWPALLGLAILGAIILEASTAALGDVFGTRSVLAGDPPLYETLWNEITAGSLPYADLVFEHLPLVILPMGAAGILRDTIGLDYTVGYAMVAAALLTWSAAAVGRTGRALGRDDAIGYYLVLVAPLLPLVLFRNDILPVLCAAIAVSAFVRAGETAGIVATTAGILAKGWPFVLVVTEWWRGNRTRAWVLTVFTAAMFGTLAALPGFQSGRSFEGVHQETLSGSIVLLWRHLTGADLGIVGRAGAVYLDVGGWAVLLNLAVGGGLALWALRGLGMAFTWHRAHTMLGALVLALILASPLLSAQFLVWPAAFLALVIRRRPLLVATAASTVTTVLFGFWDHEAMWWSITLVGRNVLVLALAVMVALAAASGREQIA